ncbi:MAG: GNAT family N-acetyltransferase [Treponema sp.]|jgi:GNAT superfamily N-acetyltransferase|nr:GNAT family N-acetyltransferase [Treponema sp.]
MQFSALKNEHDRVSFDCGIPELNVFLKEQARSFIKRGLCAIHVFAEDNAIVGYYTLSAASLSAAELPFGAGQKYPQRLPVPCWILGRLAIDKKYQGQGLGKMLLLAACDKVLEMSHDAGGYCILVDAINEHAKGFYLKYGFLEFPDTPLRLYLPLASLPH